MLPLLLSVENFKALVDQQELPEPSVLIDVGKLDRFLAGHIPGALNILPSQTQRGAPIPGLIPETRALEELLSSLGITPETHIFVYDDEGGGWAGRFAWILDEIGHAQYSYLDGGLPAWQAAGYPTEEGEAKTTASNSSYPVAVSNDHTITCDALRQSLESSPPSIWDARSPGEYTGEKRNAARGGHIPGAVNLNWTDAMAPENGLRLRPLETLRSELLELGIDGSKPIVTHCQSHHRSGLTYLICKLLGYPVKAYAGSWGEWGNSEDTPVVEGSAPQ